MSEITHLLDASAADALGLPRRTGDRHRAFAGATLAETFADR